MGPRAPGAAPGMAGAVGRHGLLDGHFDLVDALREAWGEGRRHKRWVILGGLVKDAEWVIND